MTRTGPAGSERPALRPAGGVRVLLLSASLIGFFEILAVGLPPAARGRLPLLLLGLGMALLSAWRPERGLLAFSFVFPLAGLGDRVFGGADAIAWPLLLFAGFTAGWTFRFLYDFESRSDPSPVDGILRSLAAVWVLGTILAIVEARTLWAIEHGLRLRAVNVEGLLDGAAIRDSVLSLAALAAGAAYFFVLRRSGPVARGRALLAALAGVGLSAAIAVAERLGAPPGETGQFWKMTGRLSGAAMDPNSLGLMCGLAAPFALAMMLPSGGRRRALGAALVLSVSAGLVLSGSRSGLALAGVGALLLVLVGAPGLPGRLRVAVVGLAAAVVVAAVVFLARGDRGSVGARLSEALDSGRTVEARTSTRPLLWRSAVRLFLRDPVAGAGMGAFSWQVPTLVAEEGRSLPMRDNPGNAYLQALAETGAIGFLLTLVLVAVFAREAWAALVARAPAPLARAGGAAILGFLAALVFGSHWLAPDVALLFFLFAAATARSEAPSRATWPSRTRAILVAAYALAVVLQAGATLSSDEAFRYRQGIGFYGKEVGPGGPFYWTARRFAMRLTPGQNLRLVLAHYTPEGRSVDLAAESGGKIVLRRTLEPGQSVELLLAGPARGHRVIRFSLSRAFSPKRLGLSGDRRELGVVAVFPPPS
jgi:O-antigen ligase